MATEKGEVTFKFNGKKHTIKVDFDKISDLQRFLCDKEKGENIFSFVLDMFREDFSGVSIDSDESNLEKMKGNVKWVKLQDETSVRVWTMEEVFNGYAALLCREPEYKKYTDQELVELVKRSLEKQFNESENTLFDFLLLRQMNVLGALTPIFKRTKREEGKKSKAAPAKRGRGRPKKTEAAEGQETKRKRGRPRKNPPENQATA